MRMIGDERTINLDLCLMETKLRHLFPAELYACIPAELLEDEGNAAEGVRSF